MNVAEVSSDLPSSFSFEHQDISIFLQHLNEKTNKVVDINQSITQQMRAEKIQGWSGKVGKKNIVEKPAEKWK